MVHPSADPDVAVTALVRGAFEYSGQKCSAASRAYVARSVWQRIRDELIEITEALRVGDVRDLTNFTSAVIDCAGVHQARRRDRPRRARRPMPRSSPAGRPTTRTGWYVRPTMIVSDNPRNEMFTTEYFGPILGIHVYEDAEFDAHPGRGRPGRAVRADRSIIATERAALPPGERARSATPPGTST